MTVDNQVQTLIGLAEQADALVLQIRSLLAQIQAAEDQIHRTLTDEARAAGDGPHTRGISHLAGGRRLAQYLVTQIERPTIAGDPSAAVLATSAYASISGA
ncbi:MAG: hypothetical protein KJZ80_16105 [Hyphomicrobiaceae bacterium]|nr:hypothetical protein [Hyphomicrobiaceae bacterium]